MQEQNQRQASPQMCAALDNSQRSAAPINQSRESRSSSRLESVLEVAGRRTFLEKATVAGKVVQAGWLKEEAKTSTQEYRMKLHLAFKQAQLRHSIRQKEKQRSKANNMAELEYIREIQENDEIETPVKEKVRTQLLEEYRTVQPDFPGISIGERLRLVKVSRNCQKKTIERFFHVDADKESLVYYGKEKDQKPKKSLSMLGCRISVESLASHKGKTEKEQNEAFTKWTDETKSFRVRICLKAREFHPVYHYTTDLHQAKGVKTIMQRLYMSQEETQKISELLITASFIFEIKNADNFYSSGLLQVSLRRRQKQRLLHHLSEISTSHFKFEGLSMVEALAAIPTIPPKFELKQSAPPELYSTFKAGPIKPNLVNRAYSRIEKGVLRVLLRHAQNRERRHPHIQEQIRNKLKQGYFPVDRPQLGQYLVHDQIFNNLHKLGELPYSTEEIQAGIQGIRVENGNIVMVDMKKNESLIAINEISYMAISQPSSGPKGNWNLQLRGRKINHNVEQIAENILPQQIGLERFKYSRLVDKQIIKLSFKSITIPKKLQDQLRKTVYNEKDQILHRFRIEVGRFNCNTTLFSAAAQKEKFDLKDDLEIDLNESVKIIKITLLSVKGRQQTQNHLILNELASEKEISSVTFKIDDILKESRVQHSLILNNSLYLPFQANNTTMSGLLEPVLNCGIVIKKANGAQETVQLEGKQLLVGRYVLYKKKYVAKVLRVNKTSCNIEILPQQPFPHEHEQKLLKDVQIRNEEDIQMIERFGISVHQLDQQPAQNYINGQYEWLLNLNFTLNTIDVVSFIQEAISKTQVTSIYAQRTIGRLRQPINFVCGQLFLSVMSAQNLQSPSNAAGQCDSYVQLSVIDDGGRQTTDARDLLNDISNEDSFIACKNNSSIIVNKTLSTTIIPQDNNPSWASSASPQGEVFDLGMFMQKQPHHILIEVYNKKPKSMFSSGSENELIGFAELPTEELLSLENLGQEFYLFLDTDDPRRNKKSIVKLRSLFQPSVGTIQRLKLDQQNTIFKNAQQFLFYQVLTMNKPNDSFGYRIPLGSYHAGTAHQSTLRHLIGQIRGASMLQQVIQTARNAPTLGGDNSTLQVPDSYFQSRYEKYSPEHKRHSELRQLNPLRPSIEENVHIFKQLWDYTSFLRRNKALLYRQQSYWSQFIHDIVNSNDHNEQGLIDEELRSIRSKLTNTTKMMSTKYRKRTKTGNPNDGNIRIEEEEEVKGDARRFSAVFVSQWEQQQSWKYSDIWFLIKFGLPSTELRVSIWKDLLKRQIHEQQAMVYFDKLRDQNERDLVYNQNISVYKNLKNFSTKRDSAFYQQIEDDIKAYKFPEGYTSPSTLEEQRASIYNILKAFSVWSTEFSARRNKFVVYNPGFVKILQRLLSFMEEEDAFWVLIGLVKGMKNVFTYDFKGTGIPDQQPSPLLNFEVFNAFSNRKICFKNEMTIINCLIKLHYPKVFEHLKSLSVPLEWYFYDALSSFYTEIFSSDIILRLWDMIILNLSNSNRNLRKRSLWYILAVPLYMIQSNNDLILSTQDPVLIKEQLFQGTASANYNPSAFIEDLLTIIRNVFVIRDDLLNRIFKADAPRQLESMRHQIEQEFTRDYKQSQDNSRDIARQVIERGINVGIRPLVQEKVNQANEFIIFNIHPTTLKNVAVDASTSLTLEFQGTSNGYDISVGQAPNKNLSGLPNYQIKIDYSRSSGSIQLSDFQIQLSLYKFTNKSNLIGKGTLNLRDFIYSPEAAYKVLKLQSEQSSKEKSAFIELEVEVIEFRNKQSQVPVCSTGLLGDLYSKAQEDDCVARYQQQSQLVSVRPIKELRAAENTERALQLLSQVSADLPRIAQTLGVLEILGSNPTLQFLKMFAHSSNRSGVQLASSLQQAYHLPNQVEVAKLVHQLYQVAHYPISFSEALQLVNLSLTKEYSYITKVTQQAMSAPTGLFDSLLTNLTGNECFDVTDPFRATVNSVVNLTGECSELDFSSIPFNNINFWLGTDHNQLKRMAQILTISVKDSNGNESSFSFKFNSDGIFQALEGQSSSLPLQRLAGFSRVFDKEFVHLITKHAVMLNNVIAQDLFMKHQLEGFKSEYIEDNRTYEVVLSHLKKQFKIVFSSSVEKLNDFTVEGDKGINISRILSRFYQKMMFGNSEMIEIKLSGISKQDTFMTMKQRIKIALNQYSLAEGSRDLPNILSEVYSFRGATSYQQYEIMDRIINATQETKFDLIITQPEPANAEATNLALALYTHPNNVQEWKKCRILSQNKPTLQASEMYKVEFLHEAKQGHFYVLSREDILLSYDFMRNQSDYQRFEVRALLDRLDKDEIQIAQLIRDQESQRVGGLGSSINGKQLDFGGDKKDDGVRVNSLINQSFDAEEEEEQREIKQSFAK